MDEEFQADDPFAVALNDMQQAQQEYPPERIAHDAATELESLLEVSIYFKEELTVEEATTLSVAYDICRRLANA